MRWQLAGLVGWTVVAVVVLVFVGTAIQTPNCAKSVGASQTPECKAEMAAENAREFSARTLPMLGVLGAGYLAVGAAAVVLSRRPDPVRAPPGDP